MAILPNGTVNESYRPLIISMYHLHIHRWLEIFSRKQILVVNGDQLIEDPVSQLRRIETFLGIYFYFLLILRGNPKRRFLVWKRNIRARATVQWSILLHFMSQV